MLDKELTLYTPDLTTKAELSFASEGVSAGFPSPAQDFMDLKLDLNEELVKNPASTFFARVRGDSMIGEGIDNGDLLVIDKSVMPFDHCLAVCFLDGEFTLKRFHKEENCGWLIPANPKYKPIRVDLENDFMIWGVVRYVIKKF